MKAHRPEDPKPNERHMGARSNACSVRRGSLLMRPDERVIGHPLVLRRQWPVPLEQAVSRQNHPDLYDRPGWRFVIIQVTAPKGEGHVAADSVFDCMLSNAAPRGFMCSEVWM